MKRKLVGEMIALVSKAETSDLEELDKVIAEREAQLEALIGEQRKEIDALRQIRQVCDVKLNGKPQRGRRRMEGDAAEFGGIPAATVMRLADWIAQRIEERGPQTTSELAIARSASESAIRIAIGKAKGRFEMDDEERWNVVE